MLKRLPNQFAEGDAWLDGARSRHQIDRQDFLEAPQIHLAILAAFVAGQGHHVGYPVLLEGEEACPSSRQRFGDRRDLAGMALSGHNLRIPSASRFRATVQGAHGGELVSEHLHVSRDSRLLPGCQ